MSTLSDSSPNEDNYPFERLAAKLASYDTADLLSAVGALQISAENASRVTRLEALSHCVASLDPKTAPRISSGKLREICTDPSLEALAHLEDPAENQFAEEFTFFGGSYIVFPGIAQSAEFILSNLAREFSSILAVPYLALSSRRRFVWSPQHYA